jgi:hypothetical protein
MSSGLVHYCSDYDTLRRPDTCITEVGIAQIPGIPAGGLNTGVFEFTNVDVSVSPFVGVLDIYFIGNSYNSPVTILSQNAIRLGSSVHVNASGSDGESTASGLQPSLSVPGGKPGPGGFAGGASGFPGTTPTSGSPGFGPAGGVGGEAGGYCPGYGVPQLSPGANSSAAPTSTTLTQLVGGSGGGGAAAIPNCGLGRNNGGSGGGGGGALMMVAATEINFGYGASVSVAGGAGGSSLCPCYEGGGGAGGALKLVAPMLVSPFAYATLYGGNSPRFGQAAGGTIRVEGDARQFNLSIQGQSSGSVAGSPGPVSSPTTPTLRITSIGDLTVPAAPTGNTATPDVSFPTPPSGPVSVGVTASNIPPGALVKVRVTPQVGTFTEVTSSLSGTTASSTATAAVTIPPGYGAITATASFACDGTICAILPPRERAGAVVEVVAAAGTSRAFIVTKEGRRVELSN